MIEGRLAGKTLIVTGAGSGMGAAMLARFVAEDGRVVAVSRTAEKLTRTVEHVCDTVDGAAERVVAVAVDVTVDDAARHIVEEALAAFGRIDVLVNNAGIGDGFQMAGEVTDEIWRQTMAVNVDAPMRLCRQVIPHFVEQGEGVLVATSSIAGDRGGRSGAAYTASKHALTGLMRSIAATYADQGIRANTIAAGWTATDLGPGAPISRGGYRQWKEVAALNRRIADADEVAQLALFLASDESSMLNGAVIAADAGWSVR